MKRVERKIRSVLKTLGKSKTIAYLDEACGRCTEIEVISIGRLFNELAFRELGAYLKKPPFRYYTPL